MFLIDPKDIDLDFESEEEFENLNRNGVSSDDKDMEDVSPRGPKTSLRETEKYDLDMPHYCD
jgi:hypothetical protein